MRTIPRTILVVFLVLLAASQVRLAREGARPARGPAGQSEDARPADEFDRYVLQRMEEERIPGATVLVSHRGEIEKSRGYGRDDPVAPPTVGGGP